MQFLKKNILLLSLFGLFILLSSFSLLTNTNNETVVSNNETVLADSEVVPANNETVLAESEVVIADNNMYKPKTMNIIINVSPNTAKIREAGPKGPIVGESGASVTISQYSKKRLYITNVGFDYSVVVLDWECHNKRTCKDKFRALEAKGNINVSLEVDLMYESSSESVQVNKNVVLNVKKGRDMEEAWEIIHSTILNYFDVLEASDSNSGYMRTAWVGTNYPRDTTRERVIIKKSGKDPLKFNLKFISEHAGKEDIRFDNDAKYSPHNRIRKKYDAMIGELTTKLSQ